LNGNSLKLRLLVASALAISILLSIAGLSFYFVFQRYVERVAISELGDHYIQLVSKIDVDGSDKLKIVSKLSDPRFAKPYGGLYWQINENGMPPIRSLSLFDEVLAPLQIVQNFDGNVIHLIKGPNGSKLFAIEKRLAIPVDGKSDRNLRILMAVDRSSIDETVGRFGIDMMRGLILLYGLILGTIALVILLGLRPLESLRREVGKIRSSGNQKLVGQFPTEVQGLVTELNNLLLDKQDQLERTRLRASNLAHGLKTPLTVMVAVGENVLRAGLKKEAHDIQESASQMHGLVERELARARMATGYTNQLSPVKPIVVRIVKALQHTNSKTELNWSVFMPDDAAIQIEAGDLLELIGILLDNASKWAKSIVDVRWVGNTLTIDDDGPGVPEDKLYDIQKRGVRLDESVPGSGLGLGIARDIVDVYGYKLDFARSNLGGLSVRINKA
jgi:signal transduction histidine kinase